MLLKLHISAILLRGISFCSGLRIYGSRFLQAAGIYQLVEGGVHVPVDNLRQVGAVGAEHGAQFVAVEVDVRKNILLFEQYEQLLFGYLVFFRR